MSDDAIEEKLDRMLAMLSDLTSSRKTPTVSEGKLLCKKEAAEFLGISASTFVRRVKAGDLPEGKRPPWGSRYPMWSVGDLMKLREKVEDK